MESPHEKDFTEGDFTEEHFKCASITAGWLEQLFGGASKARRALRRLDEHPEDEEPENVALPAAFLVCVDMILWAIERGAVREVLRLADLEDFYNEAERDGYDIL